MSMNSRNNSPPFWVSHYKPFHMKGDTLTCEVTGNTIPMEADEGWYRFVDSTGKKWILSTLAWRFFDILADPAFGFHKNFEELPEEAQQRYVWEHVGNPNGCLFGGAIFEKVQRWKDVDKRQRIATEHQKIQDVRHRIAKKLDKIQNTDNTEEQTNGDQ